MKFLTVTAFDGELLFRMSWAGTAVLLSARRDMRPPAERWIAHGLMEWINIPTQAAPHLIPESRHTLADSPDFLPRLADYIRRQTPEESGIKIELAVLDGL